VTLDDGSRAAIAVLEAIGAIERRFSHLVLDLSVWEHSRRTEIEKARTSCTMGGVHASEVSVSLLIDLRNGIGLNWTIAIWSRPAEWRIEGSLYWTAWYPNDGWRSEWTIERRAPDLPGFLATLAGMTDEVIARARGFDFTATDAWLTDFD
jgi:hypothetical protein